MKSKVVALSAVSASFVAVFLSVGALIDFIDVIMITAASVFVTLPLYYKSYKGSVLCYLAGGMIGALFALGFGKITSVVFPSYFLFFGIYPIVLRAMKDKKFNKIATYLIGLVWCVAAVYGMYFYYTAVGGLIEKLPEVVSNNLYLFIALFGVVFYVIYERFLRVSARLSDVVVKRI